MPELKTVIVGTRFRGDGAVATMLRMREGDAVVLRREPHNRFDARAVACHFQDVHVGFIPAALNGELSAALDGGAEAAATVTARGERKGTFIVEPKITITWTL